MTEIESVRPALSVVIDDGDFIINSTGPVGKAMAQAVLPLAASAHKVTIIADGEMRVMKRGAGSENSQRRSVSPLSSDATAANSAAPTSTSASTSAPVAPVAPDIQDQFAADLEAGVVGEAAMGESPSPTPGPSDPVTIPARRRKPVIFQDAAAPPAPELAEAEMAQLLAEAAQAEQEAARVVEDRRFQQQQAVQAAAGPGSAGQEPVVDPAELSAKPAPRKREPRQLATTGRPCGRCAGAGQVQGEAGFVGACPVCHGEGKVQTWDRSLKIR